jgi:ABC-type polysaccharide/polyol phosphate transport system ATPase subunit
VGGAITVEGVSKKFRLFHERPRSVKEVVTRRRRRSFDEFWALRDVSFAVDPGETVGVIGPNGSGKSTLLKCLARILRPERGRIEVQGKLSALLEVGAGFHPELTGRENVFLNAAILGLNRTEVRDRFDEIVEFAGLARFIDTPVKSYSSGMYVRLGFAIAVNVRPDVLLVDEVLAVGDEEFQRRCLDRFEAMRRTGRTVVLVTHALETVRELCDRAVFLREGRVADLGPARSVVDTYLRDVGDASKRDTGLSLVGHRYGSREVELTRIELCGADGRPGSPILAGAPMTVRMHWRVNTPVVDPLFHIDLFAGESGAHLVGTTSAMGGVHVERLEGEGIVEFRVDDVLLLPGQYLLSVAVQDPTGARDYDHYDRTHSFTVEPGAPLERHGLVRLPARWELIQRVPS